VSSHLHSIIHVGPNSPRGPWAPIRKHRVGSNIDVDLAALQLVLLIEPTVVLWGSVPIGSLHEGIPQQQREAVMVQAPHAQMAILEGAVRVVSHLRLKLGRLEFSRRIMQHDSKLLEKITQEGTKCDKIDKLNFMLN
jgi:hypothetical protein